LGKSTEQAASGGLNALIFKLRRRIERATPAVVPIQTKFGIGYVFCATLIAT
jgi:DNA-binding response OmpR family regulator